MDVLAPGEHPCLNVFPVLPLILQGFFLFSFFSFFFFLSFFLFFLPIFYFIYFFLKKTPSKKLFLFPFPFSRFLFSIFSPSIFIFLIIILIYLILFYSAIYFFSFLILFLPTFFYSFRAIFSHTTYTVSTKYQSLLVFHPLLLLSFSDASLFHPLPCPFYRFLLLPFNFSNHWMGS